MHSNQKAGADIDMSAAKTHEHIRNSGSFALVSGYILFMFIMMQFHVEVTLFSEKRTSRRWGSAVGACDTSGFHCSLETEIPSRVFPQSYLLTP